MGEIQVSRLTLQWLVALALGVTVVLVLFFWRGFFWQHAALVGLAVAALAYSAWGTWERGRR
jgi:hypothetical protein